MDGEIMKLVIGGVLVALGFFGKELLDFAKIYVTSNKKKFQAYMDKDTEKFIKNLEEENEKLKTYVDNIEDKNITSDVNMVIVASGGTNDWNIENNAYFHPKTRTFRNGIKYLGFYYKLKITGYGEKEKIEDDKLLDDLVKSANEKGYFVNKKDHDFFSCKKGFKKTNIDWESLGKTPVMSRQYISIDELKNK